MDQNAEYAECVRVDQMKAEVAEAKEQEEKEAVRLVALQIEMGRIYRVRM